jgi:hypothetical protein
MNRTIKDATIKTYPYDELQAIKPGPSGRPAARSEVDRVGCDMREAV